jgi:hypothetical protein
MNLARFPQLTGCRFRRASPGVGAQARTGRATWSKRHRGCGRFIVGEVRAEECLGPLSRSPPAGLPNVAAISAREALGDDVHAALLAGENLERLGAFRDVAIEDVL